MLCCVLLRFIDFIRLLKTLVCLLPLEVFMVPFGTMKVSHQGGSFQVSSSLILLSRSQNMSCLSSMVLPSISGGQPKGNDNGPCYYSASGVSPLPQVSLGTEIFI